MYVIQMPYFSLEVVEVGNKLQALKFLKHVSIQDLLGVGENIPATGISLHFPNSGQLAFALALDKRPYVRPQSPLPLKHTSYMRPCPCMIIFIV
jgi:hypothetical protein